MSETKKSKKYDKKYLILNCLHRSSNLCDQYIENMLIEILINGGNNNNGMISNNNNDDRIWSVLCKKIKIFDEEKIIEHILDEIVEDRCIDDISDIDDFNKKICINIHKKIKTSLRSTISYFNKENKESTETQINRVIIDHFIDMQGQKFIYYYTDTNDVYNINIIKSDIDKIKLSDFNDYKLKFILIGEEKYGVRMCRFLYPVIAHIIMSSGIAGAKKGEGKNNEQTDKYMLFIEYLNGYIEEKTQQDNNMQNDAEKKNTWTSSKHKQLQYFIKIIYMFIYLYICSVYLVEYKNVKQDGTKKQNDASHKIITNMCKNINIYDFLVKNEITTLYNIYNIYEAYIGREILVPDANIQTNNNDDHLSKTKKISKLINKFLVINTHTSEEKYVINLRDNKYELVNMLNVRETNRRVYIVQLIGTAIIIFLILPLLYYIHNFTIQNHTHIYTIIYILIFISYICFIYIMRLFTGFDNNIHYYFNR